MSIKLLIETELAKAEGVLAAKDLVDRVQKALEDVNQMRVKDLPDLAESLGTGYEATVVQSFVDSVNSALEGLISNLEETRNALDTAAKTLTGEETAPVEEPALDAGPDADADLDSDEEFDDFEMTPSAAGGEEPLGRPQRESVEARKAVIAQRMANISESLKKLNRK